MVDLIKKSKLKASKLGSHRRIRLTDLLEFIESESREGSEAVAKIVKHTKEVVGHTSESRERKRKNKSGRAFKSAWSNHV